MSDKNIYQKIQQVRVDLSKKDLKSTGKADGFKYFQLKDFVPELNELLMEHNLLTRFSMSSTHAWVDVIASKDEVVRFEIDKEEAKIDGLLEIQNKGATVTYLKRYVLSIAFDILEEDQVENVMSLKLTEEELKGFEDAKTFREITIYTNKLKKEKDTKFQNIIIKEYNKRKAEFGEKPVKK